MWCGVVWCGVVWCGVVWCGVGGGRVDHKNETQASVSGFISAFLLRNDNIAATDVFSPSFLSRSPIVVDVCCLIFGRRRDARETGEGTDPVPESNLPNAFEHQACQSQPSFPSSWFF